MALPSEIHPFAIAGAGQGYQIPRSLRFRASNSASLTRTPGSAGNRQKFTLSTWLKRGTLSLNQGIFAATSDGTQSNEFLLFFGSGNGDTISVQQTVSSTSSGQISCISNAVLRDPSAWYHIVLAIDTTQATSTNRLFLYINGVSQTFSTYSVGSSINTWVNNNNSHSISKRADASLYFDGYQTEIYLIDGQQLDPTYFGQTDSVTGIWGPKQYTGTYGTNGFYLPFNDPTSTTTIGYDRQLGLTDSSKNNWTSSGISVTSGTTYDSMIDSPTNYNDGSTYYNRGNYATLNPTNPVNGSFSQGNLNYALNAGYAGRVTIGVSSGKWYFEGAITGGTNPAYMMIGIQKNSGSLGGYGGNSQVPSGYGYIGIAYKFADTTQTSYGSSFTTNDIIGVAFDASSGTLEFYKNGVSQGTAFTGISGEYFPYISNQTTSNNDHVGWMNFGQRPFTYTPPTGYLALNTYNLANPSLPLV